MKRPRDLHSRLESPSGKLFIEFEKETATEAETWKLSQAPFLLAHACSLVSTIQDVTTTGKDGYRFLKLNAGMTEILRPSLYGAQHPIFVDP